MENSLISQMQKSLNFFVPGVAVPQSRPRFSTHGGIPHAYEPEKSRNYKELIRKYADIGIKNSLKNPIFFSGYVSIHIIEHRAIPKNCSKIVRKKALERSLLPATRPDLDNIIKIVLDALNNFLWDDDKQIVSIEAQKFFAESPGLEITVTEV